MSVTAVAARPERPTVLYDGRCRVCTAGADRIRAMDRRGRLDVVSMHDASVAARFPEIQREALLEEMHVVLPDGRVVRGHWAVREVFRQLGTWRRILAAAWWLPGFSWLANKAYRWFARNRYRFNKTVNCDGDVCGLHGPKHSAH